MNRMVGVFEEQFKRLERNKGGRWPQPHIYVGVDMHQTAVEPTWTDQASMKFYDMALETLQLMSEDPEVVLILWTCSTREQAREYLRICSGLGVNFRYFNENPECANTPYGDYTTKLYFNAGLDDKFGFRPEEDWPELHSYFTKRQIQRLKKAS